LKRIDRVVEAAVSAAELIDQALAAASASTSLALSQPRAKIDM